MNEKEKELIAIVLKKGKELYKQTGEVSRHTVVAGILSESGNVYLGANCDSVHGTCAEIVAYVNAIMANEKNLKMIVAASVRGNGEDRIIVPCGNCRQILIENVPDIKVIIYSDNKIRKVRITEMLPMAYRKLDNMF